MDIIEIGKQYVGLKNEEKRISKNVKEYNSKIKKHFTDTETDVLDIGDYTIKKTVQDRSTMNEEMLLMKLKELGKSSAIKTKEYVDIEEMNNLMYSGELSVEDISDCIKQKEITMIRINKNK